MRQQLVDPACRVRWPLLQHVFELCVGLMPVDARRVQQAHDGRSPFARELPANSHASVELSICVPR
jgi:hypothetical protein